MAYYICVDPNACNLSATVFQFCKETSIEERIFFCFFFLLFSLKLYDTYTYLCMNHTRNAGKVKLILSAEFAFLGKHF